MYLLNKLQNISFGAKIQQTKADKKSSNPKENKNLNTKTLLVSLAALGAAGAAAVYMARCGKLGAIKEIKPSEIKPEINLKPVVEKFNKQKYISESVSAEIPEGFDTYEFLKRNPDGFYLEYGKEVNNFLRRGDFEKLPEVPSDMSESFKKLLLKQNEEKMQLNRTILESIEIMDSKITSKTTKPMTVYRDAPDSWMRKAKDGILTDKAYLSTSTEKGASMEGVISNGSKNRTYEIRLPEGTSYWDFTDTAEKEMLLGRNCKFKVISDYVLELIP